MRCTICDKDIDIGNFNGKGGIHFPICFSCFCNTKEKEKEEDMKCKNCNEESKGTLIFKKDIPMSSELKAEDFDWAKKEPKQKSIHEMTQKDFDIAMKDQPIQSCEFNKIKYEKEDKRIEIIKRLLASRDAQIELIDYLYSAELMSDGDMLDQHTSLNENIVHLFKIVIEAS